jgi:hypothetical protein
VPSCARGSFVFRRRHSRIVGVRSAWRCGGELVTVAAMTVFVVAYAPWIAGALLGAIIAGVLNRHQPAW